MVVPADDAPTSRPPKKARLVEPPQPQPEPIVVYRLPTHYLAVQLVVDNMGVISGLIVERAGEHTKGAHTIPWMDWVKWIAKDVTGTDSVRGVDEVPEDDRTQERGEGRWPHEGRSTHQDQASASPSLASPCPSDSEMDDALGGESHTEPMPLMQLQVEIKRALKKISNSENVSNMEAVDMGGKSEAPIRKKLRDYEGNGKGKKDELISLLVGLVDVGELNRRKSRAGR